jgi:hypothetical protein
MQYRHVIEEPLVRDLKVHIGAKPLARPPSIDQLFLEKKETSQPADDPQPPRHRPPRAPRPRRPEQTPR